MINSGPKIFPLLKKAFSGKIFFNTENAEISVSVFSSLVINMDRGKVPATLSVHITNLSSYVHP